MTITPGATVTPSATVTPVASVRDLHVSLSRRGIATQVLRGVDLTIGRGEIVGLVGESGSGKSVLALALMGLLPSGAAPNVEGDVTVTGVDMVSGSAAARRGVRRHGLGVIFQDPMTSLNPSMRIGRQITEVSGSREESTRLLTEVGVADAGLRMQVFPHELSGGLRQRVMAAIALSGSPALIIADEPTTALDVTVQAQVLALLGSLRDELGCSVLFITHDLAVAAQITDRIGVMYAGRLAELGPTAEVLRAPGHPYTSGLLRSRLSLGMPRDAVLLTLPPGATTEALSASGCAYHARCPLVMPKCVDEVPPWEDVDGPAHQRSCWRPLPDVRDSGAVVAPALIAGNEGHPPAAVPPAGLGGLLVADVKNLCVRYETKNGFRTRRSLMALDGVDLQVTAGEALSVVGESGSGKSTLLRVLAGLLPASAGTVRVEGSTQMVFQDAGSSLTPWLSVAEHLRERLRPLRLGAAERERRIAEALDRMAIPANLADAKPGQLSGGQRQRVALARATVIPPSILLCDEPTSALDVSLAASVLNLIRAMRGELGMAVVFVTHDLSVARLMGDRVAVMAAGRLVEVGSTAAVINNPQHNYTRTLLAAVPEIAGPAAGKRPLLEAFAEAPAPRIGGEGMTAVAVTTRRFGPLPLSGLSIEGRRLNVLLASLLGAVSLIAVLGRVLAPQDPIQPIAPFNLRPLSSGHLLGTDEIGRDLLSRTLYGIQTSWLSALVVVAVGLLVGGLIGSVAGASGGWVDSLLMRLTDLFLALPSTLVVIAVVAALGPSLRHTLIGVSIFWWPYYARIIRGEVRSLAARPHLEAARLAGVGRLRRLRRHLLPGVVPTMVVTASLDIGNVVLLLAGLSFLGLGQVAPAPELGADTARGLQQLLTEPWVPLVPGIAVLVLSLVANVSGDALRRLVEHQ